MKSWLVLVTALALANAAAPLLPSRMKNFIEGCKIKVTKLPKSLQIFDCDGPLQLNETTFKFVNKPAVNVLNIENVIINQIEEGAFKNFKNLDDVVIVNTRIGSIDAKAFNNVKRVKFANCGFEDSPILVSEKLEQLTFGQCQMEEIPNLNGIIKLTYLNLSGNYIKNIEIETFDQLFVLEELHLSNNEIFKLPPTLFINNQALNSLTLDNNPLRRFYLNTSESLEYLSLKNCNLEVFDERSTQKLSTLNELVLSNNHIRELSTKTFANMKDLSVIDLSNNQLEKLDDLIFSNNKELIKITLDGNKLKTLPSFKLADNGEFSIYSFSCKNCGLKSLSPIVFKNMDGMMTLDLSHNEFKSFEGIFDKINTLKHLDISYNNISKLTPETFIFNRNLETLNLAGNPLKVLEPEVFVNNRILREIDARNTSLKKLWSNSNSSVRALHRIFLGSNQLTNLTFEDFRVMPTLKAIELSNNPLVFDEYLCEVIHWLQSNDVSPIENVTNHFEGLDRSFGEDIDSFHAVEWKDIHQKQCSDSETNDSDFFYSNYDNDDGEEEDLDDDVTYDDDDDYETDEASDDFLKKHTHKKLDKWPFADEVLGSENNSSLARASYILSITSVFVLSALVVLTLAVTITLCILRRSNNFNMHTANLPRLKIPLWTTTPSQKKHSGSVYRPLSEDLSGPKTPKLSRYNFTATPTVHTSNP